MHLSPVTSDLLSGEVVTEWWYGNVLLWGVMTACGAVRVAPCWNEGGALFTAVVVACLSCMWWRILPLRVVHLLGLS